MSKKIGRPSKAEALSQMLESEYSECLAEAVRTRRLMSGQRAELEKQIGGEIGITPMMRLEILQGLAVVYDRLAKASASTKKLADDADTGSGESIIEDFLKE